jgi:DNA-binding beta-propeller fold protein YncE
LRFVRARAFIGLAALLLLAAAALWWWRPWRAPDPRPDPRWTATVVVLAGDGVAAVRDGPRETARFSDPFGVAVAADGSVYVADAGDAQRIRRIDPSGHVTTLAGGRRGFADGRGTEARFDTPSALAIDAQGVLYVADTGNNAIRRIAPDGTVTTVAGGGGAGYRDGPAREARFNGPIGVAVDGAGRILIADTYNDRIRAIGPEGLVSTLAGDGVPGFADGAGPAARFDTPCGIAIDRAAGTIVVADTGNDAIRTIDAGGGVATLAVSSGDGLSRPIGIAVDGSRELFVTDSRGRVLGMRDGVARIVAGAAAGFSDGRGEEARFRGPAGLALAGPRRLVVADTGNALVRIAAAPAQLPLLPPASSRVDPRFPVEPFETHALLWPVAPMEGPHEIAGTLGEARGAEGAERFHAGIDVRIEEGTPVLAVRSGTVSQPIAAHDVGSLNESLRIGPVAYVHIRAGRTRRNEIVDPEQFVPTYDEAGVLARLRIKRGASFAAGQAIGTVNGFNHVHLNIGWPGEERNPLLFDLAGFTDTVRPTIARGGVRILDDLGQPITRRVRGRLAISGRVQIVVDAWDQADGNRPNRRLGLYELGYQILNRDGTPAPGFEYLRPSLRFDRLASDPLAATLAYAPGSGIPFYRGRRTRFLYLVTNRLDGGVGMPGAWDTSTLPAGDYIVRILAADVRGNAAIANRDLPVTIVAAGPR